MEQRINFAEAGQGALKAMLGLRAYLSKSGPEKELLELLYFRVSQINGCAYCLDMHSKDLRAAGETEQRLYLLDAWRESPFYTERERRGLRAGAGAVRRGGVGESHARGSGHQRLEPTQHLLPHDTRRLQAGGVARDRVRAWEAGRGEE